MTKRLDMTHRQLAVLGVLSILAGFLTAAVYVVHFHTLPASISETATTGNAAGMILPTILGGLGLFACTYIWNAYTRSEGILTAIMGVCFVLVAAQPTESAFTADIALMGLFCVPPKVSGLIHAIAAGVGFVLMLVWVLFYFTKGDGNPTPQKIKRNYIYIGCGAAGIMGLVTFVVGQAMYYLPTETGWDSSVLVGEIMLLVPIGVACVTKAGWICADRE